VALLPMDSSLTQLNLNGKVIRDKGAADIAAALATNSTLTQLNLSSNAIGDAGAEAIAAALANNSALTRLDLRNIGPAGAEALAAAENLRDTQCAAATARFWSSRYTALFVLSTCQPVVVTAADDDDDDVAAEMDEGGGLGLLRNMHSLRRRIVDFLPRREDVVPSKLEVVTS
jgi:hypothetical protein